MKAGPSRRLPPTALPAEKEDLTDQEIDQILARLPDLPGDAADQVDFKLAQDPIPPAAHRTNRGTILPARRGRSPAAHP